MGVLEWWNGPSFFWKGGKDGNGYGFQEGWEGWRAIRKKWKVPKSGHSKGKRKGQRNRFTLSPSPLYSSISGGVSLERRNQACQLQPRLTHAELSNFFRWICSARYSMGRLVEYKVLSAWASWQLQYCPNGQYNSQDNVYKTFYSTCCPTLYRHEIKGEG